MTKIGHRCPPGCQCGKHKRHVRPEVRGIPLSDEHKEKLRQANLGRNSSPEIRRKISESQKTRALKLEKEMPSVLPLRRRCTKCGVVKDQSEFTIRKTKLKSGIIREHLEPRCKKCVARVTKEWRERKREEGTLAQYQKKYRELTPEQRERRREWHREYQAIRRRMKGQKPRQSWDPSKGDVKVSRMPIVRFLEEEMEKRGLNQQQIAERADMRHGFVSDLIRGWEKSPKTKGGKTDLKWISLHRVDQILRGLDREEQLTILYTDEVIDAGREAQAKEAAQKAAKTEAKRRKKARKKYAEKRGEAGRAQT